MKSTGKLSLLFSILFLISSTLACNLPAQQADLNPEDIAYTLVAQTAQAAPSAAPAETSVSVTNTPSNPIVTVNTATNCRTGPDINYAFLMVLQPGITAPVVGKYTPSNYWIITMPNGSTCWLLGTYATTQGDISQLPEMTPPVLVVAQPTSTSKPSGNNNSGNDNNNNNPPAASPPAAPSGVKASTSCPSSRVDLITWHAVDNATAYNIYKNGGLVQQITAAQAGGSFLLSWPMYPGNIENSITYGVASVNSEGISSVSSATAPGCP